MTDSIPTIDDSLYNSARKEGKGWCTVCHQFTREARDPEAVYPCKKCSQPSVINAEHAYQCGEFHLMSDKVEEMMNEEYDDNDFLDDQGEDDFEDEDE